MMVQVNNPPTLSDIVIDGNLDLGVHSLLANTILEHTAGSGVTIDGVKLKDSIPYCDTIAEKTGAAGVTIDGVKMKDSVPYCDTIHEKSSGNGIVVDGVWLKDSIPYCDTIAEKSTAAGVTIDGVKIKDTEVITPGAVDTMILEKVASATARHSHDAIAHDEATGGAGNYVLLKTITFADGLKGMLRISFSMASGSNGTQVMARIYKNGIPWGDAQVTGLDSYTLKTEDVYCNVAPGDTLELRGGYTSASAWCYVKEFRVKYDNADIDVASANS